MSEPIDIGPSHVLHALIRKRAEIAGKIEHNQLALRRLIADLDHVDATIRIFDASVDVQEIRSRPVPPRHAAFKGEVTRIVLDMLREATGPLTSRDIALALIESRGLQKDDREIGVIMVKRVCACLRKHRMAGTIATTPADGRLQGWVLANRS